MGWDLTLRQSEENPRHYQIHLEILDPSSDEHPAPCSCQMAKCALIKKLMEDEEKSVEQMS
jgi:protein arginine N-methyltransferase 6